MASIDNRVVKVDFDNRSFQEKIAVTTNSVEKLKTSLDFSKTNTNASLSNVTNNISGMNNVVQNVTQGFSVLAGAASVALGSIASKAITVGMQLAKSFSLDQVIAGFREYETNMNSIQTIMSNTKADGTSLDQVNAALETLNLYSDQTIYNFSQMARNIGTFTAAGVDLDSSVNAIKGIANLAAISGSNSEQASSAMYQLSQALASGSVKLMDWNSVVNAGMGGEVFQKALWETGKALGTIKDIPIDQTFDQWKDAGNSFRETLQDGWITSEVLTNTLAGFTGDMTEAQLLAIGYTQQQAQEFIELGKTGKAAATEVKTITQLVSTVKESIASGWSQSFKFVLGDFNEAKSLLTDVNAVLGGIIGGSSNARNAILKSWKELGGRTILIEGLKNTFGALGTVLKYIKLALSDVFPPMTASKLLELTKSFTKFTEKLKPSIETIVAIRRIFRGVFSVFAIGIEIVKGLFGVFTNLFSTISKSSQGIFFFAKLGDAIFRLKQILVDGGGIANFFKDLSKGLSGLAGGALDKLFGSLGDTAGRLGERFGFVTEMGGPMATAFQFVSDKIQLAIEKFTQLVKFIKEKFFGVGDSVANGLSEGFDKVKFDSIIDVVNVGLFGGLLLLLKKFVSNSKGVTVLFKNQFLDNLANSFKNLNGVLQAMQKSIKADMILKIAIALGIMAVSLLILASIDSAALTRGLIGLTVSFGLLAGMLFVLDKLATNIKTSASIAILAGSLIALAAALLIMSLAVKVLSTMSWDELLKGLVGVGALLAMVTIALNLMPDSKRLISAGIGIAAIAIGIRILASAVQVMASMSWDQMMQGLIGIGIALAGITIAMDLMPKDMVQKGIGLVGIGVGLTAVALAVKILGSMTMDQMVQGLIGIGGALLGIAIVMNIMPKNMPIMAAGLILVAAALNLMVFAIAALGSMDQGKLIQGLVGIAATLAILAIAMYAMTGAIAGAISIAIIAGSLLVLSIAINAFSNLSWGDLLKGMAMIGILIGALALASYALAPAIPTLLALGVALILIGGGLALVGVGAYFLAKALAVIKEAGNSSIEVLIMLFDVIIQKLPILIMALGKALIDVAKMFVAALPEIISGLGAALLEVIEQLKKIVPEFINLVGIIIDSIIKLIVEKVPLLIQTGYFILLSLLNGIANNIDDIVKSVGNIIVNFLNALTKEIPRIVEAGLNLLKKLIEGVASGIYLISSSVGEIIAAFIKGFSDSMQTIINAGADFIVQMIKGIGENLDKIIDAGVETLEKFLQGLAQNINKVTNAAADFVITFIRDLRITIDTKAPELREEGKKLIGAIINGMTGGWGEKIGGVIDKVEEGLGNVVDAAKGFLRINSPSKVFIGIGQSVVEGLTMGIANNGSAVKSSEILAENVVNSMNTTLSKLSSSLENIDEFNPVISPVLDLSNIEQNAARLNNILNTPTLDASLSFGQASAISLSSLMAAQENTDKVAQKVTDIKFEQIINAPTALSTNDIYRNTKTQLSLAKEELGIK